MLLFIYHSIYPFIYLLFISQLSILNISILVYFHFLKINFIFKSFNLFADGYQEYALDELLSSSIFGGEALCKDKELRVVDFLTGHPTAYVGDNNCMLYSQGVEVAAACERDKETNNRLFCELEFQDLPEEPALSDLCSSPPSDDYLYSFFYVCVPRTLLNSRTPQLCWCCRQKHPPHASAPLQEYFEIL